MFSGFLIGEKSKDAVFKKVKEKNQSITELIDTTISVRNNLLTEKNYSDLNYAENYQLKYI